MTTTPGEGLGTRRTSVIPDVIDALIARAGDALPNHRIVDNYGALSDYGEMLMVGVEDVDVPGMEDSASSTQTAATIGKTRSRDEVGTITCVAESWNGDADQKAARDNAFATVAAVEDLLRADPGLDVPNCGYFRAQVTAHRLVQGSDGNGARALVIFDVGFAARI